MSDGYALFDHGYTAIGQSQNGPLGGGGAVRFFNLDQQGSSSTLTDISQNVTDQHSRDTFGNLHAPECLITTPDPYGYGAAFGYQSDVNSGLYQVGHRYYDPSTGRFLSRDPIQAGYNWYAYCDNDPVNRADPLGLHSQWWNPSTWFDHWGKGHPGEIPHTGGIVFFGQGNYNETNPDRYPPSKNDAPNYPPTDREFSWWRGGEWKDNPDGTSRYRDRWKWHPVDEDHPVSHWDVRENKQEWEVTPKGMRPADGDWRRKI